MIKIIIISQNQKEELKETLKSLKEFLKDTVVVLDRCTDDSNKMCKDLNVDFIENLTGQGRLTSTCRNLGLNYILNNYNLTDSDYILFLDGDRKIVEGNLNNLNILNDIELIKLENDIRKTETLVNYGYLYNSGFYSCGIIFSMPAIKTVLNYTNGFLFDESMQDDWGIEDTSLGDLCFKLKLSADFNKTLKLKGGFEKLDITNSALFRRLKYRDQLGYINHTNLLNP